ncbi:DUF3870 domain-containing protein [Fictibacillus enclensis]|nr:DUF3870 domain-containing protein [Fictibacillus enclensis]
MNYRETIICTGYSRLPDGMAAKNLYGVMGVGFEVDPQAQSGRTDSVGGL